MGFWGRHDFWEQTSRLETLVVPVETWTWNKNERSQVYIYIIFNASEQGHILTYFLIRAWSERLIYRSAHNGCICSILYLLKLAIKHFQKTFKPLNVLNILIALIGASLECNSKGFALSSFPPASRRVWSIHPHKAWKVQASVSKGVDRGDWIWWKLEGESPRLGWWSWCQDTWEISLTRVWMSWRQSGHVSSCKAHSIQIPLCEQGLSSVSAIWSQQRVQQLSLMLTCLSNARRLCLGRMIFSSDASEANSLKVLNLIEGGWRKGLAPKLNSHCW